MKEAELATFMKSVLPRVGLRWAGFRNVSRTVKKRLVRRMAELGAADLDAYAAHLASHPEEWPVLDAMCRIPISRFHRDHAVFERLASELLPERAQEALAGGRTAVRAWSAGCASGEEPYTLALAWHLAVGPRYPSLAFEVVATDLGGPMLERARRGCYEAGSLRELPEAWRARAFERDGEAWRIRDELRAGISFRREDLRTTAPEGPFDVVLCRNLAFTYFDERLQGMVAERIVERLRAGGLLVVGSHERLPEGISGVVLRAPCVYQLSPSRGGAA
jgi:chemotaxis protein methyltransferase CheR